MITYIRLKWLNKAVFGITDDFRVVSDRLGSIQRIGDLTLK